jgi:transcriptional regulator with XRE-family HTH domain
MEIGETLREARMRRRIDVSQVEEETKIRAKYLRALENEEFGQLPGPTFVRSFLRTYADYLGLDAHLLVEEYRGREERPEQWEQELIASPGPSPPPGRWPRARSQGPRAGGARSSRAGAGGPAPGGFRPGRGLTAGIFVGGTLILLLLVGLTSEDREPGAGTGEEAERAGRPGGKRRARPPPPTPGEVTLRVSPAEQTYLCVDNGKGRVIFEGTLQTARTFRGKRLRINLGRRTAQLKVNGQPVPTGGGPNPTGFDFTPSRRRPLAPAQRPC